jgi:hypothetical protein
MKVLHLTLKKKWFDMILSGEKKEEYREIKPYWESRLCEKWSLAFYPKEITTIVFTNGYGADKPSFEIELKSIDTGIGKQKWGGTTKPVFVLTLGEILSTKNIKP